MLSPLLAWPLVLGEGDFTWAPGAAHRKVLVVCGTTPPGTVVTILHCVVVVP